MKRKIGIMATVILAVIVGIGGYLTRFSSVPFEIVPALPVNSHFEDIQRDKNNPVTMAIDQQYIAVLPPYGYEIEFIDVVSDRGITMLYNLKKLDDPHGEAPAFSVKVSNPLNGPVGATCQNLYILN